LYFIPRPPHRPHSGDSGGGTAAPLPTKATFLSSIPLPLPEGSIGIPRGPPRKATGPTEGRGLRPHHHGGGRVEIRGPEVGSSPPRWIYGEHPASRGRRGSTGADGCDIRTGTGLDGYNTEARGSRATARGYEAALALRRCAPMIGPYGTCGVRVVPGWAASAGDMLRL
jgi:hypothetical protein